MVACTGLLGRLFLTTSCMIRWWFCRTSSSQLESHRRVRVGGWHTEDVQSSCAAPWGQMFVLPSLLGRRRQLERVFVAVTQGTAFAVPGRKEPCSLSFNLFLLCCACLHLMHFLAVSFLTGAPGTSFQLLPTFFLFCSREKKCLEAFCKENRLGGWKIFICCSSVLKAYHYCCVFCWLSVHET